jgi:dihydrofolate reductase
LRNKVFIATSLDGYIADEQGGIDWLTELPNPSNSDGGFSKFIESVDAVLMGRKTFEKVLSFGIDWPYPKKVFVWTSSINIIEASLIGKVEIVRGNASEVLQQIHHKGFMNLYIDGGHTIQSFLREGLMHEIIVTQVPLLLGKGIPLFKDIPRIKLSHKTTESFDNGMVQTHYDVQIDY